MIGNAVESARTATSTRGVVFASGCVLAVLFGGSAIYHSLIYVGHPQQPHMLTILDRVFQVCVASLLLLDGLLLGRCLIWLLRARSLMNGLETAAVSAGIGLGLLSLGVLALGGLHLYYPVTFVILLLGPPLLLWRDVRHLVGEVAGYGAACWRGVPRHPRDWVDVLPRLALAIAALAVLAFTALLDMTPPTTQTGYDTYQYHWAVPLLLLRAHGWQAFPGWAHANLPFNTEMLNLVALSLQAPEAATLVQDGFTLLSAVLVFAFVRRHFDTTSAWLAVVALVTVPMLVMYGSQSYVEPALLFYVIATLVLLTRWIARVGVGQSPSLALVALAGASLGLALGVKFMALEFIPGALIVLVGGAVYSAWASGPRAGKHLGPRSALAPLGVFAACGAIALGPWLLKDWLLLGNPVYPALGWLFGAPVWDDARTRMLQATFAHFGPPESSTIARFHLYALDLFIHPERYGEGESLPMGLAAALAALALPALIWAVWRGWRRQREHERRVALIVAGWVLVVVLAFAAWSVSGALVERYALPPVALASVLGAALSGWFAARLPHRVRAVSLVLPVVVAGALLFQNRALYYGNYMARSPFPLLRARVSEQTFMRTHLSQGVTASFWQATDYINDDLPHDGKLLMLGRGTGAFFSDRDYVADSGGDWVPYIVSEGKTPAGMANLLRAEGFTYVVYDGDLMHWLTTTYDNRLLAGDLPAYLRFQGSRLVLIGEWGNVSLYAVPPPQPAASAAGNTAPH